MSNIFINSSALEEQPIERGWNKKRGYYTIRRWRGQQSDAEAQRASLIATGFYTDVRLKEGPVWEVEAQADSDIEDETPLTEDSAVDTWELAANRVEKDLLVSDIASVNDLDDVDAQVLRAFINGDTTYAYDEFAWINNGSSNPSGLYKLIKAGVKSSQVFQPILRRTTTASDSYIVSASLTNVGLIYSTAQILAENDVPASIANNMPTTGPSGSATRTLDGITYTYGWMKGYPIITDTIDGKVQIQQEWEFGLWTSILHTFV